MTARAILAAALAAVAVQAQGEEAGVTARALFHQCQVQSAAAGAAADLRDSGATRKEALAAIKRRIPEEMESARFWIATIYANPDWQPNFAAGYVLGFCLGAGFAVLDGRAAEVEPIKKRQSWSM